MSSDMRFGFGTGYGDRRVWWLDPGSLTLRLFDYGYGDYYAPLSSMLTAKDRGRWLRYVKKFAPGFDPDGLRLALAKLFTNEVQMRLENGLDWRQVLRGRIAAMETEEEDFGISEGVVTMMNTGERRVYGARYFELITEHRDERRRWMDEVAKRRAAERAAD